MHGIGSVVHLVADRDQHSIVDVEPGCAYLFEHRVWQARVDKFHREPG